MTVFTPCGAGNYRLFAVRAFFREFNYSHVKLIAFKPWIRNKKKVAGVKVISDSSREIDLCEPVNLQVTEQAITIFAVDQELPIAVGDILTCDVPVCDVREPFEV